MDNTSKQNQTVVITGGSAGVGRATAITFASRGANVAVLARGQQGLDATVREIEQAGGRALALPVDVAEADQVDRAADRIESELGAIDIWINAAMLTTFSSFDEMSSQEYDHITRTTYLGTVNGTRAALRLMRPRGRGRIIQVGSALAYRSIPLQSAYCGAKAAIRGFTDSVRVELMHAKTDITISMIQLGACNTPQFDWARSRLKHHPRPLPPVYQPDVAAQAIVFAANNYRRELWITFSAFKTIVGGFLMPALTDRMALKQAYSGQNDTSIPPPTGERPDNLFTPVDRNAGARGRFGSESKSDSLFLKMNMNRSTMLSAAAIGAILVALVLYWAIN